MFSRQKSISSRITASEKPKLEFLVTIRKILFNPHLVVLAFVIQVVHRIQGELVVQVTEELPADSLRVLLPFVWLKLLFSLRYRVLADKASWKCSAAQN